MATSLSLLLIVGCLASVKSAATDSLQSLETGGEEDGSVLKFQSTTQLEQRWQSFKEDFGKTYNGIEEEESRKRIFLQNLEEIETHNYLFSKGLKTFTMGINQFTDLEFSEFLEQMTCNSFENITNYPTEEDFEYTEDDLNDEEKDYFQGSDDDLNADEDEADSQSTEDNSMLPRNVDWRKKGYVTRVKNQGQCGSCWAFSATGSLEGQHRRKTGKLVELSEQNLVDCSRRFGNKGCDGGLAFWAFRYIAKNKGIDTENSYPYEAKDNSCRFKRSTVGATCKGYVRIRRGEKGLQRAVAKYGPISVSICVKSSFQKYKSGVYYEPTCSTTKLSHAVLAVGYGRNYWIVKNSWGTSWGDNGYILMARNKRNNCGIATRPTRPVV